MSAPSNRRDPLLKLLRELDEARTCLMLASLILRILQEIVRGQVEGAQFEWVEARIANLPSPSKPVAMADEWSAPAVQRRSTAASRSQAMDRTGTSLPLDNRAPLLHPFSAGTNCSANMPSPSKPVASLLMNAFTPEKHRAIRHNSIEALPPVPSPSADAKKLSLQLTRVTPDRELFAKSRRSFVVQPNASSAAGKGVNRALFVDVDSMSDEDEHNDSSRAAADSAADGDAAFESEGDEAEDADAAMQDKDPRLVCSALAPA